MNGKGKAFSRLFKGQSLEKGPSCIFQAVGNISQLVAKAIEYKGWSRRNRSAVESDLIFPTELSLFGACLLPSIDTWHAPPTSLMEFT